MQIYSEVKVSQGTIGTVANDGKYYQVMSCIDNEFLDNGEGYTLVLKEYFGNVKQEVLQ